MTTNERELLAASPPASAVAEPVARRCLCYLIERGSPAEYWAGGTDWTSDPFVARTYANRAEAEYVEGGQLGDVRIAEHLFDVHAFDSVTSNCKRCGAPSCPAQATPDRDTSSAVSDAVRARAL